MVWKKKGNREDENMGFEEFRSVRVYTNINGEEKRYGYDYHRTSDGKEEYKEIGEIPEDFGKDIVERMRNFEKAFSLDIPIFDPTESLFDRMLSGFRSLFSPQVALTEPELVAEDHIDTSRHSDIQYDIQVDPKTKTAHVIIELPGFTKSDVKLRFTNKGLYLKAQNKRKDIETTIPLKNIAVKPETMKATMNNGILEVTAELKDEQPDEGREIPIN